MPRSRQENGEIVALGNLDNQRFGRSFSIEIRRKLEPQKPGVAPDDAVLAGVETGNALENLDANLLLCRLFRGVTERAGGHVEQEIAQTGRTNEMGAFVDALYKFP